MPDALYDFAMEFEPGTPEGRALLMEYCRCYPHLQAELVDLAVSLALSPPDDDDEVEADASSLMVERVVAHMKTLLQRQEPPPSEDGSVAPSTHGGRAG